MLPYFAQEMMQQLPRTGCDFAGRLQARLLDKSCTCRRPANTCERPDMTSQAFQLSRMREPVFLAAADLQSWDQQQQQQ